MKKSLLLGLSAVSFLSAGDLVKSVEGYVRVGYQNHDISTDKSYKSDSIGGKLHIDTKEYQGVSGGVSFYTTNKINDHDKEGVGFFNSDYNSYSILGEIYMEVVFGNTSVKLGRQELDTPFADTDDIGMIPNSFEAGVLINKDIKDTTIVLANVQKWAGVDAPKPETFTKMQNDDSVQVLGITYEGVENLSLSGWYYDLKVKAKGDLQNIGYIEATYGEKIDNINYELGIQYATQSYKEKSDAKIPGITLTINFEETGITINTAFNKSNDNSATNGFGGGPFFTSMEHLTIDGMGADAKALEYGFEWDMSPFGLEGLALGISKIDIESNDNKDAKENDFALSYDFDDNLNITAIYSDVNDDINSEDFTNLRVFANYIL
jgi:hypothetical protein